MSSRMRVTRGHSNNRRSHHTIKAPRLSMCKNCGEYHQRHRVCLECGYYKGEKVLDIKVKENLVQTAEDVKDVKKVSKKAETKKTAKTETKEVKKVSKKETKASKDDLTKIEGVGPKIASVFEENKISTFAKLAKADVKKLKEILEENKLSQHDPKTWPKQAKLADEGKWDELEKLQAKLDGGK
ncbi:50S ribosomal protein L32 [Candidatus Campbellbacteria bacterium]|nr:MAG: 50S ribosomal protein L32 [Candidatus Campbellbacteria bacterium]